MKHCKKCNELKEPTDFHKCASASDGLQPRCKPCNNSAVHKWRKAYPEKEKEKQAKYYKKNATEAKEKMKEYKKVNKSRIKTLNLKKYGLSQEQYEVMVELQNHSCKICKRHSSEFSKGLCVDHCHKSGKIRGLLCGPCNTGIGLLQDNPAIIIAAATYVEIA